mmetsp:Transcript_21500/g.53313  ORF Transcript_21500/g.53313 Transcript_21500/m.53313 type:complete len:216 (-) Transcript_21500:149-796(-)
MEYAKHVFWYWSSAKSAQAVMSTGPSMPPKVNWRSTFPQTSESLGAHSSKLQPTDSPLVQSPLHVQLAETPNCSVIPMAASTKVQRSRSISPPSPSLLPKPNESETLSHRFPANSPRLKSSSSSLCSLSSLWELCAVSLDPDSSLEDAMAVREANAKRVVIEIFRCAYFIVIVEEVDFLIFKFVCGSRSKESKWISMLGGTRKNGTQRKAAVVDS